MAPPNPLITTERHQQPTRTQELEHFISRYLRSQPSDCARAPDLLDSLAAFAPLHAALGRHGDLPDPCHCLIEGYAAPGNAESLRHYLASTGLQQIEIHAVDLYDIAATYAKMGQAIPAMQYDVADARDLRGVVPDAFIDLVIQDFLVNCVQPRDMPAIFQEVRRVLSPARLAFISFSDDQCMQDVGRVSEEDNRGCSPTASLEPRGQLLSVWRRFIIWAKSDQSLIKPTKPGTTGDAALHPSVRTQLSRAARSASG